MNAIKDNDFQPFPVDVNRTIEPDQVMPLLLKSCPSFKPEWDAFLQQSETRLVYISLGVFAQHLLHCYRQDDMSAFSAVTETIEQLYLHGTDPVKETITGGLLEAIQNIWSHNHVDPAHFAKHLKPISKKYWQSLNELWDE